MLNALGAAVKQASGFTAYDPANIGYDYADFRSQFPTDEHTTSVNSTRTGFSTLYDSTGGLSTMVDSDGLLKWAPHNLLSDSESVDSATWTKANITVSANTDISPDGTTTADRITFPNGGPTENLRFFSSVIASGQQVTYSVWVKSISGNTTFIIDQGNQTGQEITATSEWQLHTATFTNNSNTWVDFSTSGPATFAVWGFHAYRSDLGGMVDNPDRGDSYVPTTSAAKYLPRLNHHIYNGSAWVNEGVFVESEARTNLVTKSNDFSALPWTASFSTVTPDSTVSPSGMTDGSTLSYTTSGARITVTVTAGSETSITFSVYAKEKSGDGIRLLVYNNTVPGVTASLASAVSDGVDVGGGWYRLSLTASNTGGAGFSPGDVLIYYIYSDSSGGAVPNSEVYLYGAQIEAGATPSSYIPTAGSTVTRAAQTLSIPYENLPWPQPQYIGSELVTNGTFDTDSDWTKGTGWTISGGVASHATGASSLISQDITVVVGKTYMVALDITAISGAGWNVALRYDGTDIGNFTNDGSTTGQLTGTFTATDTVATIAVYQGSGGTVSFDNISVREINPLSLSIQMEGRMTYADLNTAGSTGGKVGEVVFAEWWLDGNNFIELINTTNTGSGKLVVNQKESTILDNAVSGEIFSPGTNVPFNIASRHGSTFINGAVDGTALTADLTPVALPDLSTTDLQLAYDFMGTIKTFRMWTSDLGDVGIAGASGPLTTESLSLTFDGKSDSFTFEELTS